MAHTSYSAEKKETIWTEIWIPGDLEPLMYESVCLFEGMEWRQDRPENCQRTAAP